MENNNENTNDIVTEYNDNNNGNDDITINTFLNKKTRQEQQQEEKPKMTKEQLEKYKRNKRKAQRQKDKRKQKWYQPKINSNIYISNLPKDISNLELINHFSKCGFIRKDIQSGELKVKLYIDQETQNPKGDAVISYLRPESVDLAINLLNNAELRPGIVIKVEPASFEQKGNYQARKTLVIDELTRYKNKTDIDRMLGWNEEEQEKGLLIVILKHMFTPNEFLIDPSLKDDIGCDIAEECEAKCGKINKWKLFEEHTDGIVKIKFSTPLAAEKCIEIFNKRYYNGKQIEAFYWDGKTDYTKNKESEEDEQKRIEEFGEWLEK